MPKITKSLLPLVVLIVVGAWAMRALLHPGYYTGHDVWHIVARLYHFNEAIKDGQVPPRWSGGLLHGFGYPLFIFSYQLPWFLAEPFVLAGISLFDAIKLVFGVTYTVSGITMYLWTRDMWGKKAGFAAAFVYLFTPYRFANIFVRANLGEAVAFVFFPLIFWSFFRLHKGNAVSGVMVGAIGLAGAFLSHAMAAGLFLVPVGLYFLYTAYIVYQTKKTYFKTYLLGVAMTVVLGIGLSGYYLLPAFAYKPLTVFSETYHGLYKEHFTPFVKLLYSSWGYGAIGTPGEMSRQVGVVIWIVTGLSFFIGVKRLIFSRSQTEKQKHTVAVIFGFSSFLAIFLMLKSSAGVWKWIENLSLIDFPWRFLAVTTICGAALTGYIVNTVKETKWKWLIIGIILLTTWYTNRNHMKVNQYTDIPVSLYVDSELTTNTDDEYLPKWVNRQQAQNIQPLIPLDKEQLLSYRQKTNQIDFRYISTLLVNVDINHMYFPGWVYFLDGKEMVLQKSGSGGMRLHLPAGRHDIKLIYKPTEMMRLGEFITIGSLAFLVALFLGRRHLKLKT